MLSNQANGTLPATQFYGYISIMMIEMCLFVENRLTQKHIPTYIIEVLYCHHYSISG